MPGKEASMPDKIKPAKTMTEEEKKEHGQIIRKILGDEIEFIDETLIEMGGGKGDDDE